MKKDEYIVKVPTTNIELKINGIQNLITYMEIMFYNNFEYIEIKSKCDEIDYYTEENINK